MKNSRQHYGNEKKEATAANHTMKITSRFVAVVVQGKMQKHLPSTDIPIEMLENILNECRMLLYFWLKNRLSE